MRTLSIFFLSSADMAAPNSGSDPITCHCTAQTVLMEHPRRPTRESSLISFLSLMWVRCASESSLFTYDGVGLVATNDCTQRFLAKGYASRRAPRVGTSRWRSLRIVNWHHAPAQRPWPMEHGLCTMPYEPCHGTKLCHISHASRPTEPCIQTILHAGMPAAARKATRDGSCGPRAEHGDWTLPPVRSQSCIVRSGTPRLRASACRQGTM